MKWFERGNEIKDKEKLNPEQANYLIQPSLTIFGPGNYLFRKQWDYCIVMTILLIAGEVLTASEDIGLLTMLFILINTFLQCWNTYFFVKHGRRLAWNRNRWKSFEAFEKSEKKWMTFVGVSFLMIIMQVFKAGREGMDIETAAFGFGIALLYGIAIGLPFFQAWRKRNMTSTTVTAPPFEIV